MAIIGAVIGAGAVVGIATSDPYKDYSDYSDYDNYSDYSDAAERRRRRQEEKKREIDQQEYEVNSYKTQKVNDYLKSQNLIRQSGVTVSVDEVKYDADQKIDTEEKCNIQRDSASLQVEINEIDNVIKKIDEVLGGK